MFSSRDRSLLKSATFFSSGQAENVHADGVLTISDEFREGTVFWGNREREVSDGEHCRRRILTAGYPDEWFSTTTRMSPKRAWEQHAPKSLIGVVSACEHRPNGPILSLSRCIGNSRSRLRFETGSMTGWWAASSISRRQLLLTSNSLSRADSHSSRVPVLCVDHGFSLPLAIGSPTRKLAVRAEGGSNQCGGISAGTITHSAR